MRILDKIGPEKGCRTCQQGAWKAIFGVDFVGDDPYETHEYKRFQAADEGLELILPFYIVFG